MRQARVLVGVEEDTVDEKDIKKFVDAVKPLFKEAVGDIVTAIERSQPKTAQQTWGTEVDPTAELPWQRTAEGRVRATGNIVARTEDKVGVLREGQKQAAATIEGRLDRIVGLLEQRLRVTDEDEPEGAASPEPVGDVEESGTDRPSG